MVQPGAAMSLFQLLRSKETAAGKNGVHRLEDVVATATHKKGRVSMGKCVM